MLLRSLSLRSFRNHESTDLQLGPGLTALVGNNGAGKSNVVEAIGFAATLKSFRGATNDALVREGDGLAVVRTEVHSHRRDRSIDLTITNAGVVAAQLDRQRLSRARDLLGVLQVTVFSPDDLVLVKGSPGERRDYIDDVVVGLHPAKDAVLDQLARILKQRNALLKQISTQYRGGRAALPDDVTATLEVWNSRLVVVADEVVVARRQAVAGLAPVLDVLYRSIAGKDESATIEYAPAWREVGLREALAQVRDDEFRRGVTLVGPHRDDIELEIAGRPARTHASQGQQRSLALALRLASHELLTQETGDSPVLLLDDVFSELDPERSEALVKALPNCQTVLTTASVLPEAIHPEHVYRVAGGRLLERGA